MAVISSSYSNRVLRLSAYTDARNAMSRLTPVWKAETLASYQSRDSSIMHVDPSSSYALEVKRGSFQWEEPAPPTERATKKRKHRHGEKSKATETETETSTPAKSRAFRHPGHLITDTEDWSGWARSGLGSGRTSGQWEEQFAASFDWRDEADWW